jgi:hypothetical protein
MKPKITRHVTGGDRLPWPPGPGGGTVNCNFNANGGAREKFKLHMADQSLAFPNAQRQQQNLWCWAASSINIEKFYNANSAWTQCTLVNDQEVSQFTEGPFVDATDKAVKIVRKLPKLKAAGFELRLLRIPAVYQMALWLHSTNEDLMVPLEPSSIGKEGKAMPADEFFGDLAELARAANFRSEPE